MIHLGSPSARPRGSSPITWAINSDHNREGTDVKQTDGLGNTIVDDALYYVQDARSVVGNCGSWWAPNGAGYVCSIDDAGQYTGADVRSLRETDVPWPIDHVMKHVVRHVRVDNQAFTRNDDIFVQAQRTAEQLWRKKRR